MNWSMTEEGLLCLYIMVLALLCLYGLHRLELCFRLHRLARQPAPEPPESWPKVTVQLPIRNEKYVVKRLIEAVAALDYPRHLLEIQLLDDSDDETSQIAKRCLADVRARGIAASHVQRPLRTGYKAGALALGHRLATGDLLLILDADFVVPCDFLKRAVPAFTDERVGLVQARWAHLNAGASPLTRAQALMLDGHFAVEHKVRAATGRFFNFNGTAGIFRREAIDAAGGWQHDTLTEDLDLSYRMQLAGYRGVYLDDVEVPAELPADIAAFKSQQHRWAKGSLQTCRKLLGHIWKSKIPLPAKIEATFHLTDNIAYFLLLLLSLLTLPTIVARADHASSVLVFLDLLVLVLGVGSLFVFYGSATGGDLRRIRHLPILMALGIGLALNNTMAVMGGLFGIESGFVRTPKTGGGKATDYRPRRDFLFFLELLLFAWCATAFFAAFERRLYASLPLLLLLSAGHAWVGFASLTDAFRQIRRTRLRLQAA